MDDLLANANPLLSSRFNIQIVRLDEIVNPLEKIRAHKHAVKIRMCWLKEELVYQQRRLEKIERQHELCDDQWHTLQGYFSDGERNNARATLHALLFVMNGNSWKHIPKRYGHPYPIRSRIAEWVGSGLMDALLPALVRMNVTRTWKAPVYRNPGSPWVGQGIRELIVSHTREIELTGEAKTSLRQKLQDRVTDRAMERATG